MRNRFQFFWKITIKTAGEQAWETPSKEEKQKPGQTEQSSEEITTGYNHCCASYAMNNA